jgi:hypothetical protein
MLGLPHAPCVSIDAVQAVVLLANPRKQLDEELSVPAHRRFAEARQKRPAQDLRYEFVDTPLLGTAEWREPQQYDVVTCMFAVHYFFVTEQTLKQASRRTCTAAPS